MKRLLILGTLLLMAGAVRADVPLGSFDFNSSQFGNSLLESDGGTFSSQNWLNVVNADPGNPAYLTGANFDTGIANIGLSSPVTYTIGYNTPIVNGPGDDLGVVVARFSTDSFLMGVAISPDGTTFTPDVGIAADTAVDTGVTRTYFYNGGGPYTANLLVHSLDLGSVFGLAAGDAIAAVRITGNTELDLIRAAGFGNGGPGPVVPLPGAVVLAALGLSFAGWRCRRRGT